MKAMGDTALGKVQAGDEFFKEGVVNCALPAPLPYYPFTPAAAIVA